MKNYKKTEVLITGLGVTSAIGQGKKDFKAALLQGRHAFDVMQRPGRQRPGVQSEMKEGSRPDALFLGAEIPTLTIPDTIPKRVLRTASFSGQVALVTLHEAWNDAKLDGVEPDRIGLVIGGSNFQQRELIKHHESYQGRLHFMRPSYGVSFMDSDLCGLCTELYGIRGFAYTLGGASASGQLAVLQAIQAVRAGQVDICIVIGALMDLSYWESQGFRAMGAMGSDRYANEPALACRPFDQNRDGFIYGESCGVVVLEKESSIKRNGLKPYARLSGWATGVDGNRNPNPSFEGEVNVIQKTLKQANLSAKEIDYINPHGTGSRIGDEIELKALRHCDLVHPYLNATKSITGHGLSAAGTVEIIATLLQMESGQLHPTRNLETPIASHYNWVRQESVHHVIKQALNLSIGFGGVNTAICIQRY